MQNQLIRPQNSARRAASLTLLALLAILPATAQLQDFHPSRFNLFSPQQDVAMGKDAAQQVMMEQTVINDPAVNAYVTRIGEALTKSPKAGSFPYTFHVIQDPSINAFALPGGPVFVNTGLLAALDNESQLAGVLAHEISHVALRHGTTQVTKSEGIQLGLMLGASMLGKQGSIWNTVAQLAGGFGAQSLLLKNSRDHEKQADLNGAQIMNDIGYDPVQMAVFFQKLEAQGQQSNGFLANFLADHPSPGNRVEYVSEQNRYLPKKSYIQGNATELTKVKNVVASLPKAAPPKTTTSSSGQAALPDPSTLRPVAEQIRHRNRSFVLYHPKNWDPYGDPNSDSVTIAPKAALVQGQNGQTQIAYGIIASYYYPQDSQGNTIAVNLSRDTQALLQEVIKGNPGMKQSSAPRSAQVAGNNAYLTPLTSTSPFGGEERDAILTVDRPEGLFYMVFIAPNSEWNATQATFDKVVRSIEFTN